MCSLAIFEDCLNQFSLIVLKCLKDVLMVILMTFKVVLMIATSIIGNFVAIF